MYTRRVLSDQPFRKPATLELKKRTENTDRNKLKVIGYKLFHFKKNRLLMALQLSNVLSYGWEN